MAKGIFSFLFKNQDTGAETGSKKDGKGDAELVSMGNAEAAKQVQLSKDKGNVKGKENSTPTKKVANREKRKYKAPRKTESSQTKANQRRKAARKVVRTRTLEINDKEREARQNVNAAKQSSLNKETKVKAIKDFIDQLPPETQDLVKEQIKQKVNPKKEEKKVVLKEQQEKMSKRELLERKRGAYREEQSALRLAKLAAEKAREMVKAVRDRVLRRKTKNAPATKQNINQKQNQQGKDKSLNVAKVKQAKENKTK